MSTQLDDPRAGSQGPAGIQVVGLGPGDMSLLTLGALDVLLAAERIFFRTLVHPTVDGLRARLRPEQQIASFDERYERAVSFDVLYLEIAETLLAAAAESPHGIAYAVPGHPLVGERSVRLLLAMATERGIPVAIVDGLSFLEPLIGAIPLDPLAESAQLVDGTALLDTIEPGGAANWSGLSPRLIATGRPLVIGQVYDRRVASACKLWLLDRYPPSHPVLVITGAGTGDGRRREVALAELDHSSAFDHLTSIYVPPLAPLDDQRSIAALPFIAARLRAPDGCPWDRKQTWDSLKPHLLEEAYEAVAALDAGAIDQVVEELGDVLLLITMLAQIGEEEGVLDLPQIVETLVSKLVRRHPHVFGDLRLDDADAVLQTWERVKASERDEHSDEPASALDGVPIEMPALIASQVMQRKAAGLCFDWEDQVGVLAKVREELAELLEAESMEHRLEEMGNLFFALVSLCRFMKLDAEEALRRANAKFRRRFGFMERQAVARGQDFSSLDMAALDLLWREAKATERA